MNSAKKVLKIIIYIFTFFILYFLELFLFENLKIAGIKPNLFIIAIIIISLYIKPYRAFAIGVACGILLDLLNGQSIGITAIGLGILGYCVSNVKKMFSIESKLSLIIFIFIGTISYEIVIYLLNFIIYNTIFEIKNIIKIIFIETLYNILLTIIFYPLCKKILKINTEELKLDSYLKMR